jgi:leucine-rich repeat/coiled-coil domain-containing protein 1
LFQDRGKLESQVTAQQSVIEGLREERQLWGKELAHQGASLAQDRGRMEAELGFLTKEVGVLREQLHSERDAVRVKEKQLEDQAHTILTLKKTLGDKEAELKGGGSEVQELRLRLEREEASSMDMQVVALFSGPLQTLVNGPSIQTRTSHFSRLSLIQVARLTLC